MAGNTFEISDDTFEGMVLDIRYTHCCRLLGGVVRSLQNDCTDLGGTRR